MDDCNCAKEFTEILNSVEGRVISAIEGLSYQSPNRGRSMIEIEKARVKTEGELELDKVNRGRLEQFRCLREKGNVPAQEQEKSCQMLLTGKLE